MKPLLIAIALLFIACSADAAEQPADHLYFAGESADSPHIVFIAGDGEYRSEEALPMLAQLMARSGFRCTVLFSMGRRDDRFVDPGNLCSLSNLAALDSADAIVLATRFRLWPDEIMARFVAAFERGVAIVGLRTSQLAFHYREDSPWRKYSWKNGHRVHWKHNPDEGWQYGFGGEVLGDRWIGQRQT